MKLTRYLYSLFVFLSYQGKIVVNCWLQFQESVPQISKNNCGFDVNNICGDQLLLDVDERAKLGQALEDEPFSKFREQSRIRNLSDGFESYSGFLTVNKKYNSNLFFWFVPAAVKPETAPVILWLNGGPGTSSLFGLFVEHGPLLVGKGGILQNREYAWTRTHSIIYMDSPVGTGFSFTDDSKGYGKNQGDISQNLYTAMRLFYQIFPEFLQRDFYIAGESYAGKYIPSLGVKIHAENIGKKKADKIRLKGVMIGSGYFDPYTQNEYGDFLYNLGLIDGAQRDIFLQEEATVKDLIEGEEWVEATAAVERLIVGDGEIESHFQNMTGFTDYFNMLQPVRRKETGNYIDFVNNIDVRRAIHVGNQPFTRSIDMLDSMREDISKSVKPSVETLLQENYRVLFYASQLDVVVPQTGIQKFISTLDWAGSDAMENAPRRVWLVNGMIAGYTKFARNFAFVLLRSAGHLAAVDQPIVMYDLMHRFTRGLPF
ncbi:venom serine carboxypeptidase [Folsomia candida]|uniref:venom serine carboxypeptidase n=1 Tax=Folsomia candida TaxID=158441 RepID=UPI001604D781|nr:venom serine carboxypeptidase [Folsomia candida]